MTMWIAWQHVAQEEPTDPFTPTTASQGHYSFHGQNRENPNSSNKHSWRRGKEQHSRGKILHSGGGSPHSRPPLLACQPRRALLLHLSQVTWTPPSTTTWSSSNSGGLLCITAKNVPRCFTEYDMLQKNSLHIFPRTDNQKIQRSCTSIGRTYGLNV